MRVVGLVCSLALTLAVSAQGYVGDAEFEERRELSRRGLSVSGERWVAAVDHIQAGTEKCEQLKTNLTRECTGMLRSVDAAADNAAVEFEDLCVVNFACPTRVIESGALDKYVDTEDISANIEMFAEVSSWGLDRIDQPSLPLNNKYSERYDGSDVNVYIVDTGTKGDHKEFSGRYTQGGDFVKENSNGYDMNGHGTHCAGSAAGSSFGAAPNANVIGVKVLNRQGSGDISDVIKGVNWAVNNQKKKFGNKAAVISLSLGGGANTAMDRAVKAAARAGHIVVVAAGNNNNDACKYSPARAGGDGQSKDSVITVMSSDKRDRRSSFSNFGKCTDIIAPGTDIKSSWVGGTGSTKTISGTSMATPHVAGVAAQLLQKHNGDKKLAQAELFSAAASDKIKDVKAGSNNLLLQVATDYQGPPTVAPTRGPTLGAPGLCSNGQGKSKLCPTIMDSTFGPTLKEDKLTQHHVVFTEEVFGPRYKEGCKRYRFSRDNRIKDAIVLVSRGDCDFITKVKYAAQRGAAAVLIVQNSNAVPFAPQSTNGEVDIFSGMISRKDGEKLKTASKQAGFAMMMGPGA